MNKQSTNPIERIRIGLEECEKDLMRNDLSDRARIDLELRRRNAVQWLRAASEEGVREVERALGHPPTRSEIMIHFINCGGAAEFARTQ